MLVQGNKHNAASEFLYYTAVCYTAGSSLLHVAYSSSVLATLSVNEYTHSAFERTYRLQYYRNTVLLPLGKTKQGWQ
jgi:hypothetical protein